MKNHIVYQQLEEKYIPSALECLFQARTQKGAVFSDLGCSASTIKKITGDPFTGNVENQRRTLITIDTTKENFVAGIIPSVDFCDHAKKLRTKSKIEELNVLKEMEFILLEPYERQNFNFGQILYVSGLGTRSEYNGLGIASNLTSLFLKNSRDLGYKGITGITYNPISTHILTKQGWKVQSHIRVSDCEEVPQKYKNKLKLDNIYLLAINLQNQNEILDGVDFDHQQNFQASL